VEVSNGNAFHKKSPTIMFTVVLLKWKSIR